MLNLKDALDAGLPLIYVQTNNDLGVFEFLKQTFALPEKKDNANVLLAHPVIGGIHTLATFERVLIAAPAATPVPCDMGERVTLMLKDTLREEDKVYVFFEADELLWSTTVQQALRTHLLQHEANILPHAWGEKNTVPARPRKTVILVGSKGEVPSTLQPFTFIADETDMTVKAVEEAVDKLNLKYAHEAKMKDIETEFVFTPDMFNKSPTAALSIYNAAAWAVSQKRKGMFGTLGSYVRDFMEKFRAYK